MRISRNTLASLFALVASLLFASAATAAIVLPQVVTNVSVNALDDDGIAVVGPPLLHIDTLSSGQGGGGLFTNQISGTPATSGRVITIAAAVINTAIDGATFTNVAGPNGRPLFYVAGLAGDINPGDFSVTFDAGSLTFFEASQSFDARRPDTWTGGTLLGTFDLVDPPVSVSPNPNAGQGGAIGAGVPAGNMNVSFLDPSLQGGGVGNFLFEESSDQGADGFFTMYETVLGNFVDQGGMFVKSVQAVDESASGLEIQPGIDLTAAGQAALDAFAASLLGLANFASSYGGDPDNVGTNFTMNPDVLNAAGSGDFFAAVNTNHFPTVDQVIPEPGSLLVWAGLLAAVGYFTRRLA